MNILFDIAHPAHVHLLRNLYSVLVAHGHNVYVTVKEIPSAIELLRLYGISYLTIGHKRDSILGKGLDQFLYDYRIWRFVRKKHIDIGMGSSLTLAHVSRISSMKSIILDDDDDEVEPLFAKYGHPFADVILSPQCIKRKAKQTINYLGGHELAYLYPNRFVPDEHVLDEIGLKKGEPFFILRFNAFKAHHDVGVKSLTIEDKLCFIDLLSKEGKIFITTERDIDAELMPYKLSVSPTKIHSLIYYATMLIGDSQTMTSEAVALGTPSIRCNSFVGRLSYIEEEEHTYHLTYGFLPLQTEQMFAKIKELLAMPNLRDEFQSRRQKMLADKIDVTAFLTWFIENYPESKKIMKENPDYQYNFK